jgi:acetylornithine deacetylase/succinyl-diaminopimelate desuccinylase-like protein
MVTAAAARVADLVDRETLVGDLGALIRIASVTGSEERVTAAAAARLTAAGMTVEVIRPDLGTVRSDAAWPGEETTRT